MLEEALTAFHLAEVIEKQIKASFTQRLFGSTNYLREIPTRNVRSYNADAICST